MRDVIKNIIKKKISELEEKGRKCILPLEMKFPIKFNNKEYELTIPFKGKNNKKPKILEIIKYKGIKGCVIYSKEDEIFHGKILDTRHLFLYEGKTREELKKNFEDMVLMFIEDKIKD